MGNFKWLHLSDLHFRVYEGFDMSLILERLREILKKETENEKFRYIFLTGDLADCCDYTMVEQRIKELLLGSEIMEDGGKIFWVCGNHDIPRTLKHRKREIEDIRNKDEKEINFENEFEDLESRKIILGAFDDYYAKRDSLFEMKKEGAYPHQVIHTDEEEIVLLNTCLTSCDDEDEHNLYLCEPDLISLFREIEPGKPVFVLGHHSVNFLADSDRRKLLSLFREKNVSIYLCGHSHQLGVQPLSENIQEVVSGGFKMDGYAILSFFIGIFDGDCGQYELVPYTYRSGSMNWGEDYCAAQGIEKGKKYQIYLPKRGSGDGLSDMVIQSRRLFQEILDIEKLDVNMFNKIGERVLRKYVQTLPSMNRIENMDFFTLCEEAVKNGNKRINYTSLRMTETIKDIWRFRENFIRVLHELGRNDVDFQAIKEMPFDFDDFFEMVNRFDVTENAYVLVTDAIHDMDNEKKKMLAEFRWDVILDYDGYSDDGGLRSYISGQNIKDLKGDYNVVRESILRRGITSWIRIGEQMKFSLGKAESEVDLRMIKRLFEEVVRKLYENTNGTVILVFMKDIEAWDKELMRIIWDRFEDRARFVMVGAYDKKKLEEKLRNLFLDSLGNSITSCYKVFQTSTVVFLKKYSDYSENFLEKRKYENMQFPSNNGLAKLEQNLYINLGDFFEVMTSDIGMDLKNHNEDVEKFYLGGEAAWSLFYTKEVLDLMEQEKTEELIKRLKTVMGSKQEQQRNAIFYLLHSAGFGGTTTAKAIAWRMHKECPTLILKNYEYGKIKPLIENLYDNHSRKGILIIADESRFSIGDLENLEREMGFVDRPFALLVVKRIVGRSTRSSKNAKNLSVLSDDVVSGLKTRFEGKSHLEAEVLKKKNEHFNDVFPKNSGMRCPFLIGLYYQDKWFNGIYGYVEHILRKVDSERELKLLLVLAVINYYGRIGVTKDIVKKYVSLSANSDYLENYPYAKEAYISFYDEMLQVKLYREKHPLISEEIIRQCSEKLYRSGYQESLKDVSEELIEKILEINNEGLTLYYKNLLECLFIYKNATDVDEKGYTDVTEFSPLILALPSQASKEEVMCTLAEGVRNIVNRIPVEGNELYFKMAAHICGHLGRLYKASTISLQLMENSRKSIEWCKHAEEIMLRGRFVDAYIYHMYGTSLSKQCQDKLHAWSSEIENCSDEEISKLETDIKKALDKFNETIYAGEFVRGCISKLSLLMEYMQFLMKWKKVGSANEIRNLSDEERDYIKDIDDLIGMLEENVLDSKDEKRLLNLKNKYKSEIMFNNYGKAVEYYTNSIKNVIKEKGEDAEELFVLRSGLAGAILGKYKQEGKNPYLNMLDKDVDRILEALEKNIFSTVVLQNQWERQKRCNDCHRWLKVAKQSSMAVKTGIKVAEKWEEFQKGAGIKDPRPYYYLGVLHYLDALDGYPASLDIARINQKEAYRIANNNSSFRLVKPEKIRDVLLQGKGMNRIKSVLDLSEVMEHDCEKIIRLRGKFQGLENENNPNIGIIKVIFPQEMVNTKVYFKMGGKNSISINQTTHMLEFGVGVTFERLEAINSTVKDITSGEL